MGCCELNLYGSTFWLFISPQRGLIYLRYIKKDDVPILEIYSKMDIYLIGANASLSMHLCWIRWRLSGRYYHDLNFRGNGSSRGNDLNCLCGFIHWFIAHPHVSYTIVKTIQLWRLACTSRKVLSSDGRFLFFFFKAHICRTFLTFWFLHDKGLESLPSVGLLICSSDLPQIFLRALHRWTALWLHSSDVVSFPCNMLSIEA